MIATSAPYPARRRRLPVTFERFLLLEAIPA